MNSREPAILNSFQLWAKDQAKRHGLTFATHHNWVIINDVECMTVEGVNKLLKSHDQKGPKKIRP